MMMIQSTDLTGIFDCARSDLTQSQRLSSYVVTAYK